MADVTGKMDDAAVELGDGRERLRGIMNKVTGNTVTVTPVAATNHS